MTYGLQDVPIKRIAIEHYLFDLGLSVEKTAEIFDEDKEYVKKIHDDYMNLIMPGRKHE